MGQGETASEPSMDEILSSIRKIIAEDEVDEGADESAPAPPVDQPPAAEAPPPADDDILELTEDDEADVEVAGEAAVVEETVDDEPAPVEEPSPAAEATMEEAAMEIDPDTPEPAPSDEAAADTPPAPVSASAMSEMLLDSGAASAANGALQRLSAAMTPGAAIPEGDRTIEAFLADLVRPELKAWLDEHLPGLVERIVEREIKKLVRDAQPE
jgi:cell pole-organizing protein PopZ